MKRLIMDLDGTICTAIDGNYEDAIPDQELIDILRKYKKSGFDIVISTSRNVRTYDGNVGKININTLPIIIGWLKKYDVPYDEIYVAKPWCGNDGFYVDDKAIRPSEFKNLSYAQIQKLISEDSQ